MKKSGKILSINIDKLRDFLNNLEKDPSWGCPIAPNEMVKFCTEYVRAALENDEINVEKEYPVFNNGNHSKKRKVYNIVESFIDWLSSVNYDNSRNSVRYLQKMLDYAKQYGQDLEYIYADEHYVLLATPKWKYVLPADCVELQPYQDYSDTPMHLLGSKNELSGMLPALKNDVTENSIRRDIRDKQDEIQAEIEKMNAQKEEQKAEIERMKAEIEAKYAEKIAALDRKKEELELKKEQLSNELFILETQIYGIRCFFGETVTFTKIASGKDAAVDIPVVLHQKIRFLDEELSKWMSIYGFDTDDSSMFEELLVNREDMRNLFFPGDKSISLVRISKDGKVYESGYRSSTDGNQIMFANVMNEYDVYHGKKLGILVRNGENCYLAWTDDEMVSISDGNVFLTPKEKAVDSEADVEEKDWYGRKKEKEDVRTDKNEVASRYFLFSIMQGLISNSKLINLPDGVSVTGNNSYVIFSMADAWLKDTRYGDLSDIMEKYNGLLRKGDPLLTLSRLGPEGNKYSRYNNDRGIGYRNRTHDVLASDNTIYKVNFVINTKMKKYCFERRDKIGFSDKYGDWEKMEYLSDEPTFEEFFRHPGNGWKFPEDMEYRNVTSEDSVKQDVYVALKKDPNWLTGKESTANFQLYPDEYINLTFLNTDLIRYVLTNGELGSKFRNRNFSSVIPYLNHALQFLKEREKGEQLMIEQYASELSSDWRMKLSDWKMENDIHVITEYQAKRFAKSLRSSDE